MSTTPKKQTAAQYRRMQRQRVVAILLKSILILTLILFAWLTDLGCALGWISNAKAGDNWPPHFVQYGYMMIAATVLMTAATVLVFCHKNWLGMAIATVGITLCLIPMGVVAAYAADSGFYSRLMDMPVDTLYYRQILPTLVPYGCILGLGFSQFFSVAERERRQEKRRKAEEAAPPII